MKLALIVPGGVDRGGEHRVIPALLALIERLAARHQVRVFALHQESQPGTWVLRGARIHNIGEKWTRTRAVRAILAAHRAAGFDLVQSVFSGSCGLVAVAAARVLAIPSVVHVAGGEPVRFPDIAYGGRLSWRGRWQEALVMAGASAVTAASQAELELLAHSGVEAQRVPLGVDTHHDWPAVLPRVRHATVPPRLIHVASLNRVKDQPTLLRAVAGIARAHPQLRVDIVGEDTLGGEIHRLAHALGLGARVHFHGFLTQRQLHPLVRQAHVSLISSRHEAGPLALLEAALAGVPTVGTAVGHLREWAPEAAVGVPVGDWPAMAAGILQLLSDEPLRLRLGHAAQRRALTEDADHTAACFERLYGELLGPGRRHRKGGPQ